MRFALALLALALCSAAPAQGIYKCKDAAGKISYIAQECVEAGLMPGGDMKETNIAPAQKPPPPPIPDSRAKPQSKPATIAETPKEEEVVDPANPNRRCFKTAKGIRCNEKPPPDPSEKAEQK